MSPPLLTVIPAENMSENRQMMIFVHSIPSGIPIATPIAASRMPSIMTRNPSWLRNAPTARSIASVRCRSDTPIDSELKTMNIADTIDTMPPR